MTGLYFLYGTDKIMVNDHDGLKDPLRLQHYLTITPAGDISVLYISFSLDDRCMRIAGGIAPQKGHKYY
jgi:hypothetical protein